HRLRVEPISKTQPRSEGVFACIDENRIVLAREFERAQNAAGRRIRDGRIKIAVPQAGFPARNAKVGAKSRVDGKVARQLKVVLNVSGVVLVAEVNVGPEIERAAARYAQQECRIPNDYLAAHDVVSGRCGAVAQGAGAVVAVDATITHVHIGEAKLDVMATLDPRHLIAEIDCAPGGLSKDVAAVVAELSVVLGVVRGLLGAG